MIPCLVCLGNQKERLKRYLYASNFCPFLLRELVNQDREPSMRRSYQQERRPTFKQTDNAEIEAVINKSRQARGRYPVKEIQLGMQQSCCCNQHTAWKRSEPGLDKVQGCTQANTIRCWHASLMVGDQRYRRIL